MRLNVGHDGSRSTSSYYIMGYLTSHRLCFYMPTYQVSRAHYSPKELWEDSNSIMGKFIKWFFARISNVFIDITAPKRHGTAWSISHSYESSKSHIFTFFSPTFSLTSFSLSFLAIFLTDFPKSHIFIFFSPSFSLIRAL